MKKGLKIAIIVLAVVLVVGAAIGGYFIYRNKTLYISKQDALEIALSDSGVDRRTIIETDADLEKTAYAAVYEVEIETADAEYKYVLDASTGEILSRKVK